MHLFLRTVGFSEFDTKMEEKLIKTAVKESISAGYVMRHEGFERGIIQFKVSEHMGMYIYGTYVGKKFKMDYYYPYLTSELRSDNDEITVERHCDKESYAVVCDELKAGVTLIFYLQNVMEYMNYITGVEGFDYNDFDLSKKNILSSRPINGKQISITAMSVGGMILLPVSKNEKQRQKYNAAATNRKNLLAAAKNGDEEAIESLTIEDLDTYTQLSRRIIHEDVFTIVDSSFMPCGIECDQYSIVGEILDIKTEKNIYTDEEIYIMTLDCNDMTFDMAINSYDLVGEPAIGRRFKGQVWLQGAIDF